MTNRELFHATMQGENGDKLLRMELSFNIHGPTWRNDGLPHFVNTDYGFPELTPTPSLFDTFSTCGFLFLNCYQFCVPPFEAKVLEEKDDRRIYIDANGATWQERMDTGMGIPNGSIPHEIDFTIKDRKSYLDNRYRLTGIEGRADMAQAESRMDLYRKQQDHVVSLWMHGPFAYLRVLMGTENAMLLPYDDPDLMKMILDDHLKRSMAAAEPVIKMLKPDTSYVWEDCAGKSGPFMSPSIFEELMAPWYRGWKDFLKSMGVNYMSVDCDGNMAVMAKHWHQSGVDLILPWEVNGCDMLEVAEELPTLAMMGGIYKHMFEPNHIAQAGRFQTHDIHEAIDTELKRVVPKMKKRGRYFPAMDHAVNEATHYADYRYYTNQMDTLYGAANQSQRMASWAKGKKPLEQGVDGDPKYLD